MTTARIDGARERIGQAIARIEAGAARAPTGTTRPALEAEVAAAIGTLDQLIARIEGAPG